jgi:dihydroorotase
MTAQSQILKIRRPDDWHIHLRDDDMLKTVVPYTSEFYGRAIVMPNLVPPVTTVAAATASALWTPCRPGMILPR